MPKFGVRLRQTIREVHFVEEEVDIEVEAETEEEARRVAQERIDDPPGDDDIYNLEWTEVHDEGGEAEIEIDPHIIFVQRCDD